MWLQILDVLARMRLTRVLVLRNERIGIVLLIQVAQRVVDLAMLRFVRSDVQQQVSHGTTPLGHVPILNGNVWRHKLLPLWQAAGIKICNLSSVRENGFLLKKADEAMTGPRGDEVGKEEGVEEDTLGA